MHAQATSSFTLESALKRANSANFDLLLSREQIESSVQAQRRARANLLPQVSAAASQGRSETRGYGRDAGTAQYDIFDARLRASLSLFDVNHHANYRVARFNTEIARLQLDQTAEDVRAAIAQLYFTHLRNLRQADTFQAQIERDRVLFDLASKRAEAGTATRLDATRAEVRLAASELRLIQQETVIFQTALEFKRALDLELDGSIELAAVPVDLRDLPVFSELDLEQILARRPEVVSERQALERNQLAQRAANYEWLPSVELSGDYGIASDSWLNDKDEVWTVGVGISVPIFEGFRIDANRVEAASAVRAQVISLRKMEKSVESEYRLALAQIETAARSIQIATKQVELSERELDLAQRRFAEGVANNSEVVNAQASLAEAEDGLVAAEYQFNLSRLALARSQGDVLSLVR